MTWLLVMLVIGIIVGRLSYRYAPTHGTQNSSPLLLAALACLPLLTACGGGDGDGEDMETPPDPAASGKSGNLCGLAILFMADPNSVCSTSTGTRQPISPMPPSSSTPTPPPPTTSGPTTSAPPPPSGPIRILGNDEQEPNDDIINANAVRFTISDADIHDSFTFARPRGADFNIELCPPEEMICERTQPIDTGTAFIEVLDQDGNIVKSSADDGVNFGRFSVEPGLVYYVRVVAGDTMGATVGYRLTAYETN